jgi:CDP-diacylglycerol--glycerol-3-phosphate 3-phosphatidyltransferase
MDPSHPENLLSETLLSLARLHRRWLLFAILCCAVLAAGFTWLQTNWQPDYAVRWLGQSAVVIAYLLWVLWRALPENIRTGESRLLPTFGAGNSATLLRGVLIACLAGFLFSPRPAGWQAWIPALVYTMAALLDYMDGYLARATDHATRMGESLDLSLDGVGVLMAALLAVQYGQAPAWYLIVALARYIYLACLWVWGSLGQRVYPLAPSVRRRAFAGLQMGFLFVILWPVFSPPGTHLAAALFALPFLAGFILDGLTATGIIRQPLRRSGLWTASARWLPVLLRLLAVALIVVLLSSRVLDEGGLLAAGNLPATQSWIILLGVLEAAVGVLLLLGAAARITAILGLGLLGISQIFTPLTPVQVALAVLYTAILYLGSGAISLWTPENRLIYRRAGERRSTAQNEALLQGEI